MLLVLTSMAWAAPKTDRIKIRYVPPANPEHQVLYDTATERRMLERLQEFLSPFKLPRSLTFELVGCDGEADAFYGDNVITICYEYAAELWQNRPSETTPGGVAPFDAFRGPLIDTCLHEFAHALIDVLELPVFGRMEDAADQISAYIYLQLDLEDARRLIGGTAYAFLSEAADEELLSLPEFADDHSLPAQRAYNVLCMAYGADKEYFGDLVSKGYLPAERAEFCEEEICPRNALNSARKNTNKSRMPLKSSSAHISIGGWPRRFLESTCCPNR
jgi:hypothetical protein